MVVSNLPDPTLHTTAACRQRAGRAVAATVAVAIVGTVVLCAAAIGIGLLLTRELLHGSIGRTEAEVVSWLAARRAPTLDDLSSIGSSLAATGTVVVIVAVAVGMLAWRRHWRELGIVVVAIAVEGATYATATYVVARHRPRVARLEDLIVADSYFSGHVAASVALYGSLAVVTWRLTRRTWARAVSLVIAVVVPALVALSRMYRGMHYASDAAVGALVGVACVVIAVVAVTVGARVAQGAESGRAESGRAEFWRAASPRREVATERMPRIGVSVARANR